MKGITQLLLKHKPCLSLLPLQGLIHKKLLCPSSCRNRTGSRPRSPRPGKTIETKRLPPMPPTSVPPPGTCAVASLGLRVRHPNGQRAACRAVCQELREANTPSLLLKEFPSAESHSLSLTSPSGRDTRRRKGKGSSWWVKLQGCQFM